MNKLVIEATKRIPNVCFNPENGVMEIEGRSIPEDAVDFYKPLIEWVESYAENPQNETIAHFKLEYYNTASAKSLANLMKAFERLYKKNNYVTINWYYDEEDEDMLEAGEEYKSLYTMPFNMIERVDDDE